MIGLGTLSFAAPWVLVALAGLPVIFWLLRALPPAPRQERFPGLMLLLGMANTEETPVRSPWWLLLLRVLIAALVIIGLAGPSLNAPTPAIGSGPVVLIVDNGWSAAGNWDDIKSSVIAEAQNAERANRPVILIQTAPHSVQSFAATGAGTAEGEIKSLLPNPWVSDRGGVWQAWQDSGDVPTSASIFVFSDGVARAGDDAFFDGLAALGNVQVFSPRRGDLPMALRPVEATPDALNVSLIRPSSEPRSTANVTAYGENAHIVGRVEVDLPAGKGDVSVGFSLPHEARNKVRRVEIEGQLSAGAVTLLDDRWQNPTVGLVQAAETADDQPLLSDQYYLERALKPNANVQTGTLTEVLEQSPSVLFLSDVGRLVGDDLRLISDFVDEGGLLIRFAGPRMAAQSDDLVPLRLRSGGRAIGGAMSWEAPQALAPFEETSPFYGLSVPADVTISRQVLAEPGLEVSTKTWARLSDGTPLVTSASRGRGRIILFHVAARPGWSNLALSGLFVEMLKKSLSFSAGQSAGGAAGQLAPLQALDGFGGFRSPPPSAIPVDGAEIDIKRPTPAHPPGLYGTSQAAFALNTTSPSETLTVLTDIPSTAQLRTYAAAETRHLAAPLLAAALILAIVDGVVALFLAGKLRLGWPAPAASRGAASVLIIGLVCIALLPHNAYADDMAIIEAASETRLAFIETGDIDVDAMSRAGLEALSRRISQKTALNPASPVALNVETDDLTLYPLIFWAMTPGLTTPSQEALARLDRYLKTGGMILFDTRDQDIKRASIAGPTDNEASLRRILGELDIPRLQMVPEDHVLAKSFYLLDRFPGRWAGGEVWVEAHADEDDIDGATNDGVSSVIIGAHDWAASWATDALGRPMVAVAPGGERQREMSYRFGTNIAMYALTGNYKGDMVHTKALIERLGE